MILHALLVVSLSASGVELSRLSWVEAKEKLKPETVVVIPLGAASKEHGPHLKLDTDLTLARGFADRVRERADVVVAPVINYHFYPPFMDYAGSTTLSEETATALVVDVVRSLAHHGPRRFYVLNTGFTTLKPLQTAAATLAKEGILMRFFNPVLTGEAIQKKYLTQKEGTHADELETSMVLHFAPKDVDMKKAVAEFPKREPGKKGLSPVMRPDRNFSASGVYGDPTLATAAKGKAIVDEVVAAMIQDVETLRGAALPTLPAPMPGTDAGVVDAGTKLP